MRRKVNGIQLCIRQEEHSRNAYIAIGDLCRLSERTIRNAFARKPITWQTAKRIANAINIDVSNFRIKKDSRGNKKKAVPENPAQQD